MSDFTLEQIVNRLCDRRDRGGSDDLHELTYQLALQVKAMREELAVLRRGARARSF